MFRIQGLPKEYGDWHVIYVQVNGWANKGVLGVSAFTQLGIIQIKVRSCINRGKGAIMNA